VISSGSALGGSIELLWVHLEPPKESKMRPSRLSSRLASAWTRQISSGSGSNTPTSRITGMNLNLTQSSIELARDLQGVATSGSSLGRLALQEVVCRSASRASGSNASLTQKASQTFVVNGPVPQAHRFVDAGYDVQLLGFGRKAHTGDRSTRPGDRVEKDCCSLEGMRHGYQVLIGLVQVIEACKGDAESVQGLKEKQSDEEGDLQQKLQLDPPVPPWTLSSSESHEDNTSQALADSSVSQQARSVFGRSVFGRSASHEDRAPHREEKPRGALGRAASEDSLRRSGNDGDLHRSRSEQHGQTPDQKCPSPRAEHLASRQAENSPGQTQTHEDEQIEELPSSEGLEPCESSEASPWFTWFISR